jgi:hypothetical protein
MSSKTIQRSFLLDLLALATYCYLKICESFFFLSSSGRSSISAAFWGMGIE